MEKMSVGEAKRELRHGSEVHIESILEANRGGNSKQTYFTMREV